MIFRPFNGRITRKSCVNAKGKPTAAYQVTSTPSADLYRGGGGTPNWGTPCPDLAGWYPHPCRGGGCPHPCQGSPHLDLAGVSPCLDLTGVPPCGQTIRHVSKHNLPVVPRTRSVIIRQFDIDKERLCVRIDNLEGCWNQIYEVHLLQFWLLIHDKMQSQKLSCMPRNHTCICRRE